MSRILIADDHAVVRAGYRQFLDVEPGLTEVGEAANGEEVLAKLRAEEWDLLLLDMQMPGTKGLDIVEYVTAELPKVKILVMSGLPETQYARTIIRAGASGYLSKSSAPTEMLKAVRTVLSGRRYVSAELAEIMASDLDKNMDKPLHARLSTREFQVFCKLAGGAGVSAIAAELTLSVKTVSTYRSRIMEKLTFKSNADITAYALRHDIIK